MFSRFRQRSHDLEHLDKGDYSPEEFEGCMVELRRVNRWLGDARAMRRSLLAEVEQAGLESFSLIDVGAGSGELLRVAANWLRRKDSGRKTSGEKKCGARFIGVELNARAAREIGEQSRDLEEISAVRGDALQLSFAEATFDYAICSLFTHHFKDLQVVAVLRELSRVARRRIFVIDLHRHPFAYYFYITVGRLFLHNRLIREDGALSILRSFKPDELANLANQAGLEDIKVVRTFPYRLVLSARKTRGPTLGKTCKPAEVRS